MGRVGSHYLYKYFQLFKQIQPTCTEGVNAYLRISSIFLTCSLPLPTFSVMTIYIAMYMYMYIYTLGRLFRGLQILQMVQKIEFVEIIFTNDIGGVHCHSLQYT